MSETTPTYKPTLCVDFDGVIHSYTSGWQGITNIPDPMVRGAARWLMDATQFWRVAVFGSRSESHEGREAMKKYIELRSREFHGIQFAEELVQRLEFPEDKPPAVLSIDDRAITFCGDWSQYDPEQLLKFKPWPKLDSYDKEACGFCGRHGWRPRHY